MASNSVGTMDGFRVSGFCVKMLVLVVLVGRVILLLCLGLFVEAVEV